MTEEHLLRDFAVIMAVAGLSLILFRTLRQPPVLGYIVAGVVIGPFTLPIFGITAPVSVHSLDTVRLLADLGLIILLFAIGLEFGWRRIRMLGPSILIIGAVEITFMTVLGYQLGMLMGWTSIEAIFLGGAVSISSSAIILKMLRDTGILFSEHGRIIVGILVVEDFAAVLLLSILSGVASSGAADFGDLGPLLGKLGAFVLSVIILGGVITPYLMRRVARFRSVEALLIIGLALCFGLALIAGQLGVSAAAGAFIIGAVIGDADHAEELNHAMGPVRDMFSMLFFVSIGMLIDVSQIAGFIVPALLVTLVFVIGKTFVDTVATFLAGHARNTPLHVGFGMPQMGEFSLAFVKTGADRGVVGSFLYPVIVTAATLTTLIYPFIFRSADGFARILVSVSPPFLRSYVFIFSGWMESMRRIFNVTDSIGSQVRDASRVIIVNAAIVVMMIAVGTFMITFAPAISDFVGVSERFTGLGVTVLVVALCFPSGVFVWRALRRMIDIMASALLGTGAVSTVAWGESRLHEILRDTLLIAMIALLFILSLPFLSELLALGSFAAPAPILIALAIIAGAWRLVFKMHAAMEEAFRRAFIDGADDDPALPE